MLLKSQANPEIARSANQASSRDSYIQASQLHQSITGIGEPHFSMSCKSFQHKQFVSSWIIDTSATDHMVNTFS